MLARMFAGDLTPSQKDKQGRYFIDRSGQHFGTVLAYLRGEQMAMVCSRSLIEEEEEANYYQVHFELYMQHGIRIQLIRTHMCLKQEHQHVTCACLKV